MASRIGRTDPDGLNIRQRAFVVGMLKHGNQRQAYLNAGYHAKSLADVDSNASRLTGNDKVSLALARARAERADRLAISTDRVLEELAARAFSRMTSFASWDSGDAELTPSADLIDADVSAIKKIVKKESFVKVLKKDEQSTEILLSREVSMELHDPNKPLEKIYDHLGMKPEGSGADGGGKGGESVKDGQAPVKVYSKETWDAAG